MSERRAHMPRPPRRRSIGGYPDYWSFSPEDDGGGKEIIVLLLDEYEAIRLIDREGLTQEQCAEKMGVARTTVTAIYDSARRKIARAIVDGRRLQISGGSYRIAAAGNEQITAKGNDIMRLAVTYENGEIYQHFGHTAQFKLYDIQDGKIVSEKVVDTNGSGHGALAGFLAMGAVDALICGGIGMGAQMALREAGIRLYAGVQGSADEAAKAFAEGRLDYDPDARCDHHDHEGGHDCGHGGHDCGEHHHADHGCGHHDHGHGCGR
jgi:predicted DNA-binding protein (UPF0251 family)/predicted Fe-Mo cluster-binding NifX family protein